MKDSMTSPDLKCDLLVAMFRNLESQFIDCLSYIPLLTNNYSTVSPKLIPITIESCSLIDSIFSACSESGRRNQSLKTFSEEFEPLLHLSNRLSIFLGTPLLVVNPFENWKTAPPGWWLSYNKLKHDRLANLSSANMNNALNSLAGLHQAISSFKRFIGGLIKHGWINTFDEDVFVEIGSVSNLGSLHPAPPNVLVESTLFLTPSRHNIVTNLSINNLSEFDIDWDFPGLSDRVRSLVYAHQDWTPYSSNEDK